MEGGMRWKGRWLDEVEGWISGRVNRWKGG